MTYSWVCASTPGVTRTRACTGRRAAVTVPAVDKARKPGDLVEGVDDDPADAGPDAGSKLCVGLVVAVKNKPVGRHAGRQRHRQLTPGGDVEPHALLGGECGHRLAQEGFRPVGHARARRTRPPPGT